MHQAPSSMRGARTIAAAIALQLLITVTLAGTALAQSSAPGSKTTFIYGDTSEPSSLNPIVGYLGTDYTIWAMEYNLPIEFSVKDFGPDYAHSIVTKVDTASDNMTFTYHMRSGLKWSDGQPFTADDVAWTLNFYKSHHISAYIGDLTRFVSAEATNPTTFVIHTDVPTSVYNGQTTYMYEYILPEHIWGKWENDVSAARQFTDVPAVGSGPWIATEYKQGDRVTLERNPYYWGSQVGLNPQVDEIVYKIFGDENQEAAALQQGEIDFGYFDSANILNSLKGKPNIATKGGQVPLFDELAFNTGSSIETDPAGGFKPHGDEIHAVTDPAFRRALREAVDNAALVKNVYGGYAVPGLSPVQPDATTGPWQPPAGQELPFNLDQAKADLTAAGYVDTDGNGIVNDPVTKQDVVLRYYVQTKDANTLNTAPYVQNWFKQIGVGTELHAVTSGKLGTIIEDGTYDMFHWGWYPNPDPNYILSVFTCDQRAPAPGVYGNNDSFYCNKQFDQLYQKQTQVTSTAERADIVHQMQDLLWQDMPYLVIGYVDLLDAYRTDKYTGYLAQPEGKGDLLATWGAFSFINLRPVSATSGEAKAAGGISAGVWIALVVAVVVIAGGILVMRRRGESDEDKA
jgi:peptide/nickel transport system substrate-binding protein